MTLEAIAKEKTLVQTDLDAEIARRGNPLIPDPEQDAYIEKLRARVAALEDELEIARIAADVTARYAGDDGRSREMAGDSGSSREIVGEPA